VSLFKKRSSPTSFLQVLPAPYFARGSDGPAAYSSWGLRGGWRFSPSPAQPAQPRSLVSKVLQDKGFPDWYPVSSHFCRCADVPWLNCDGSTCRPAMLVWM
jgi:hypothetical protein